MLKGLCKVSKVVDVATLTGACIVALGTEIGGLFSPSKELAGALKSVSEASGAAINKPFILDLKLRLIRVS